MNKKIIWDLLVKITEKQTGVVASIEKHTRITVPYPVEKTKKVLKKATEADNVACD